MQHIIRLFLVTITLLVLSGCKQDKASRNNNVSITGSGNLVTREENVTAFNTVEAGLHWQLTIQQGEEFQVMVTSDDNFIDFINVVQQGKSLVFDFKPEYAYNIYGVTLQAQVTVPEAINLRLTGSSSASLDNLDSLATFGAELSGVTAIKGRLDATHVNLDVGQNAYVELNGTANELWLDTCGNSITDLSAFVANRAEVEASCNSTAIVNVARDLAVEASQFSRVSYTGSPSLGEVGVYESASIQPH